MRDQQSTMAIRSAINPGTYSDDPPPITIDRQGFDTLTFALSFGAGGITFTPQNMVEFLLEHSDDGQSWDPVGPDNVIGATADGDGVFLSQMQAHPSLTMNRVGYVDGTMGDRRYVRLRADFRGTHSAGTPLSAVAILGHGRQLPAAA